MHCGLPLLPLTLTVLTPGLPLLSSHHPWECCESRALLVLELRVSLPADREPETLSHLPVAPTDPECHSARTKQVGSSVKHPESGRLSQSGETWGG